jgi:hypothetical protein
MSQLPGRWTEDTVSQPMLREPESFAPSKRDDLGVTDFCNEHLRDLRDLENVEGLIASLNEQQEVVTVEVVGLRAAKLIVCSDQSTRNSTQ